MWGGELKVQIAFKPFLAFYFPLTPLMFYLVVASLSGGLCASITSIFPAFANSLSVSQDCVESLSSPSLALSLSGFPCYISGWSTSLFCCCSQPRLNLRQQSLLAFRVHLPPRSHLWTVPLGIGFSPPAQIK